MITTLTYVSLFTGGILVLLLLLSLLGVLDLDLDIGGGDTDIDSDAGGIGLIKGILTFVSVSSWVMKILLHANKGIALVLGIGMLAGLLAFLMLNYLLKLLLSNTENVNWELDDALYGEGSVYLKVPAGAGSGIVNLEVKGVTRELKAKTSSKEDLPTGATIRVIGIEGEFLIVEKA